MKAPQPRLRLILSMALLASAAGAVAWSTMPREEDPRLARRGALIVAAYPGADVLRVERLVALPIEEELSEIAEIDRLDTTIREGVAIFNVELQGSVTEPGPIWDEVDDALQDARAEMPEGVRAPSLNRDLFDTEAMLVALTGSTDRLALVDAAEELESALIAVDDVSRVQISGDPGEQITVDVDDASVRALGVNTEELAGWITASNSDLPAGSLRVGSQRVTIRPGTDFGGLDELRALPIPVRGGAGAPQMVRLDAIAQLRALSAAWPHPFARSPVTMGRPQ